MVAELGGTPRPLWKKLRWNSPSLRKKNAKQHFSVTHAAAATNYESSLIQV